MISSCSCSPKCPGIFLPVNDEGNLITYRCPCSSCHGRFHRLLDLQAKAILQNDRKAFLDTACQIKLTNRHGLFIEMDVLMESWREWQSLDEGFVIWAGYWLASSENYKSPAV